MFEQTFLTRPETARKPYSMVLSLTLQLLVLAALCLLPFVFTQALPSIQSRSVLAAPPRPPNLIKVRAPSARLLSVSPNTFHFSDLPRVTRPLVNAVVQPAELPPGTLDSSVGGDPNGVPAGALNSIDGATLGTAPPLALKRKASPQGPVRVGTIAEANLVHKVQPLYPQLARINHIQGTVEFNATISKRGEIENLQLLRGHPLLVKAARDAVLQWRYRPTLLNGQPVEVITDIIVNFTLNQ